MQQAQCTNCQSFKVRPVDQKSGQAVEDHPWRSLGTALVVGLALYMFLAGTSSWLNQGAWGLVGMLLDYSPIIGAILTFLIREQWRKRMLSGKSRASRYECLACGFRWQAGVAG